MVRMAITSPELEHEIWIPFMRRNLLSVERIMEEVERVIQSNDEWLFGDFFINFIHAPLPVGGGMTKGGAALATYLKSKRCFIQIPQKSDNLCCARAIVTAKARIDHHPEWNSIRQGRGIQTKLAKDLHKLAQVPEGQMCGKEEWDRFQTALGSNYQLIIWSRDFFNAIIYTGSVNADNQIYLYHAKDHFSVITSIPAFLHRAYYCKKCDVGYNNPASHFCPLDCKCCKNSTECPFETWVSCSSCHRYFVSNQCLENHFKRGVCHLLHVCVDCGKNYHTYRKHKCGENYCKVCKKQQPTSHQCFIQPKASTTEKEKQLYIFYDFECMTDEHKQHVPNLCVVHRVCDMCMQTPITTKSDCKCGREQTIFRGENTLKEFCDWLFSGRHKGAICIAHNAQAYDLYLIMEYVHDNGMKPEIIQNGKKILCMQTCAMKFIDSLNYFNTSLAKLPQIFGLNELHKGYFPHLFSTKENQGYKGPMPDVKFYDPDGMKYEKQQEFLLWYSQQEHFDFQADLVKYCISDVDILQRCCGKFRELFLQYTGNIEPFVSSVTIASACNEVYRTLFLKEGEIAIIPPNGYHHDNQSAIAMCWLDWMVHKDKKKIQHAGNGGEVYIRGMKVDGFDTNDESIFEFHGCMIHGCKLCYHNRASVNPFNGLTMDELYRRTTLKTERLRNMGYIVIEKWECEFRQDIKENLELQFFYKDYEPYEPLRPRDAFFGGRTNAITLYYVPKEDEHIKYVDFTSLYPYICKYGLFPIGHPQIFYGDDIPELHELQGLLKCKILPPGRLFHGVLPYRLHGKLLFPLCLKCATEKSQTPCKHSDDERALTGTWVSCELTKAVEKGYIILKKYAAWHFEETTQYDPITKQGGLWADYIDMWCKEKQQADGYPSWCHTEEDKQQYIEDYHRHEGIHLDPDKIERNEGLRSLCKIMLNSHWGKFGQNPNKSKLTYVADPKEYIAMMTDDTLEITDLLFVNKEHVALKWNSKKEFLEPLPNTNVVLAAYTTVQARLRLYSLLEKLEDRALYMDTDSVIYVHKEGEWNPPLGDYLGELKDETHGVPITAFVSGGAKSYSYTLADGSSVTKIKGFTLSVRNSNILNFESLKSLVTTPGEILKPVKEKTAYEITDLYKIVRKNGHLYTKSQSKQYKLVYDKRMITDTLKTYPYGWK